MRFLNHFHWWSAFSVLFKMIPILTCLDWAQAFDRQDPTIAIKKFLQPGVSPSSYLCCVVTCQTGPWGSALFWLIGGGPQGTLTGQTKYLVQSNDNADCIEPDERFKCIDDLSILQLLCLSGLLVEYDFRNYIASVVGIGQQLLGSVPASICDFVCTFVCL